MEKKLSFEVVNVVHVDGQWLEAGDIFNVFVSTKTQGFLELSKNKGRGCKLYFDCDDIEKLNPVAILEAINTRFNENAFELVNVYLVDLI